MKTLDAFFLGSFPIAGALSALAIQQTTTRFGHSFMQFGPSNLYLIGTIGAVHQLATLFFTILFDEKKTNRGTQFFLLGTLPSAGIIALTGIAAKVNLISARLSLFAGAMLGVTSIIGLFALLKLHTYLEKKFE